MSNLDVLKVPSLYLLTQGLVGAKHARKKYIEEYARIEPGMRILDIGCGPGYVVQYLPKVCYFGFDISPAYINYAKQKYGARGTFFAQAFDANIAKKLGQFDVILMAGLLHHLHDSEAVGLLDLARQAVRGTGRLVTLDPCYHIHQSRIAKFLMDCDRGDSIREASEYARLASRKFGNVRLHVREDLFFFPYTAAVMVCELN